MSESTPTPPGPPPHVPPTGPKRKNVWVTAGLAIGIAFVIGQGLKAVGDDYPSTPPQRSPVAVTDEAPSIFGALPSNDAEGDVKVTKCAMGGNAIGMADVEVRVTNSTDRVQSYMITVSVNDAAGNRLTEANGASNSVRPGQAATAELLASAVDGAASCAVANVTRFPS